MIYVVDLTERIKVADLGDVVSIAAKCLRAPPSLFSPNLIEQSSYRILTTHTKTRPILHDDRSIRLGENRHYQSFQTFGGYADVV